jgi:DNA-directed RNA polymerase subunit RPC12/RpoP
MFKAEEDWTISQLYDKLRNGEVHSSGVELAEMLRLYDSRKALSFSSNKMPTPADLMDTSIELQLSHLPLGHQAVFIEYICTRINNESSSSASTSCESPPLLDSITEVLMRKQNHYPSVKPDSKKANVKQYNALVSLVREKKFGVKGVNLIDVESLIREFSSLLWIIDPHFKAMKARGCGSFHSLVTGRLLGFNDPSKHNNKAEPINGAQVEQMVLGIEIKLDRKYFESSHLKFFLDLIRSVLTNVTKYLEHMAAQRERVSSHHKKENTPVCTIEDFTVTELKQVFTSSYASKLQKLRDKLIAVDFNDPVEIRNFVDCKPRNTFHDLIQNILGSGFPHIANNVVVCHFKLHSQGPHPAVHFIWKESKTDKSFEQRSLLVSNLRRNSKSFYNRASRKEIKHTLAKLGLVKPHMAEYLIRTILNDSSEGHDKNQKEILDRLNRVISLGEDIIVDLRNNNGMTPKFDAFWDVVQREISEKTAVNDRRHDNADDNGDIVTNMALALSYADLYRTCVSKASDDVPIPSYDWFLLQFWPTTRTMSRIFRYTGRFKVKRMVQARILRKQNADSHYTNAVYSFLKERAIQYRDTTAIVSSDAKCKISVGEPGTPIAAVSRGKKVLVGINETFQVTDHDYSKISLIPDANFFQTIPLTNEESWYRGQVFYSIKDMALQGSTAYRGVVELSSAFDSFYDADATPQRLFLYADGGGDRLMSHLKVQKALIALFLHQDFDEVIAARPAAYQSFRNPVERCHAVTNLALQGIGVVRQRMSHQMERLMKNCNGNEDVRKQCEANLEFREAYRESIRDTKELIEHVIKKVSLKDTPYKILPPLDVSEVSEYVDSKLNEIDPNFPTLSTHAEIQKFPKIQKFFELHTRRRTYYIQIKKCSDLDCEFHKPLKSNEPITNFPDPEPYEVEGVQHYKAGDDPGEKFLPSKLENPEKRSHGIPFSPTAQTAKCIGFTIKCSECGKPRLLHSKNKLTGEQPKQLKIFLGRIIFVCGSSLAEYDGPCSAAEEKLRERVFVRENLSCASNIELPYYSVDFYKSVCIYCGREGTGRQLNISDTTYPKCNNCGAKPDVVKRKRNKVVAEDLAGGKKKEIKVDFCEPGNIFVELFFTVISYTYIILLWRFVLLGTILQRSVVSKVNNCKSFLLLPFVEHVSQSEETSSKPV